MTQASKTPNRGRPGPRSKLDDLDVKRIRELVAAGFRHKTIALEYGITPEYVCMIAKGVRRA